MAKIDDLVLRLKFDNSKFRESATETMSMLDRLKTKLSFKKGGDPFKESVKGAKDLQRAVQEVDLSKLAQDVESVKGSFSALGVIGRTALGKLTVDAMGAGRKIIGAITEPLTGGGMRRALNIEQAEFMLEGLGANVESIMDSANEAVLGTAYSLDEAAKAASQFYASGVSEGEEMTKALLGISGVAAMTSSGYGEIADIFTTVAGQGKLMTQQLNQFASRGLNVAATLAKEFGVTESEVRDMVSKSKISFEDFSVAMSNAYGEHATKAGETFEGALANAKAPLARIGADIASVYMKQMTGLFNALKPLLDIIHGALEPVIDFINKIQIRSISGVTKFIEGLTSGLSKQGDLGWIGDIGKGIANIMAQVDRLRESIRRAGFRQWIELGAGARAIIEGVAKAFLRFTESLKFSELFLYNNARIFGALFAIVDTGITIIKSMAGSLMAIGDAILRHVVPHLMTFVRYIARAVSWVLRWVKGSQAIEGVFGGITAVIVGAIRVFGFLLEQVTKVTDAIFGFLHSIAVKVFGGTIFDPSIYPEKQAAAFVEKLKDIGKALGRIPLAGLEALKGLFSILKTSAIEFGKTMASIVKMIDFSWITKSVNAVTSSFGKLGNIKNPFRSMSGPSLDFKGVNKSIEGFGESMRESIRKGEALPWERITDPIKRAFKGVTTFVSDIDWSGAFSAMGNGIKAGVKTVGGMFAKAFSNTKEFLGKVDWAEFGSTLVEKIGQGLTKAKDLSVKIAKALTDAFKSAVESIDFGAIWDGVKDFGKGVKEGIFGAKDEVEKAIDDSLPDKTVVEVEIETTALEQNLDNLTVGSKIGSALKQFGATIKEFFQGLFSGGDVDEALGGAETFGAKIGSVFEKIWGVFEKVGQSFSSIVLWISDPISTMWTNAKIAFEKGSDGITDMASGIGEKFQKALDGVDLVGLLNAAGLFSIGAALLRMSGVMKSFKNVGDAFSGALTSVGTAVLDFGKAAKTSARGDFILKLAVSLGILAVSLFVLSKMQWEDLGRGLVGLGAALAMLIGAASVGKLGGGDGGGFGKQIALLAGGLLVLYFSIRLFHKMDMGAFVGGLMKIVGVLAVVALAALGMSAVSKKFGQSTSALEDLSKGIMRLALALGIMALAMWMFKSVDAKSFGKAMGTLVGVTLAISIVAGVVAKAGAPIKALAFLFLSLAGSLLILGFAMDKIGDLSAGDFIKSAIALVGVLAILGVATKLFDPDEMAKIGFALLGVGVGMLALAGAIVVLAFAVKLLADMDFGELMQGVLGVGLLTGILVAALNRLSEDADGIQAGAKAVFILVAAIAALALIVYLFKDASFGDIGPGIAVIVAATGALVGLLWALDAFPTDVKAAAALIVLSGAIFMVAGAVKMLEDIPMGQIVGSITALTLGIVALAGVLAMMEGMKGAIASAAAILVVSFAVVALAFALQMLSDADPAGVAVAAGALVGVIIALAIAGAILGAFPEAALGLLALAGAIAILAFAIGWAVKAIADGVKTIVESLAEFGPGLERTGRAFQEFEKNGLESLKNIMSELSVGDILKGFLAGGTVGKISEEFGKLSDDAMTRAASNMRKLAEVMPEFMSGVDKLRHMDIDGLKQVGKNLNEAFTGGFVDGLEKATGEIQRVVDVVVEAVRGKHGPMQDAGRELGDKFRIGIRDKTPDAQNEGRFLAIRGAEAAKGQRGVFVAAGSHIASGLAEGLKSRTGEVKSAASELAAAAAKATKAALEVKSPSRVFRRIGGFVGQGFAQGIEHSTNGADRAASNMAQGVVDSATHVLEIRSPSRKFQKIGHDVNAGLAKGINDNANVPKNAIANSLNGVIGIFGEKHSSAAKASDSFVDALLSGFADPNHYRKMDSLVKHSQALRATAIKEQKIADAEERERREDERDQVYRDVREAQKELREARKEAGSSKSSADKASKDHSEANQKVRDAEKKYRRALSKKERYEYQQYGTEAGVAFRDGVAVGLIDDSDKIPTFAEQLSEVLLEEFDKVKTKADEFIGAFEGFQSVISNFRNVKDHTNDLRRAFTRLTRTTNPRAFMRNLGDVFDASLAIGKEVVGVLDIVDKLEPFVPMLISHLDGALPAIASAVAPIAPGLAATLGSGISGALAAITGPVGMAAAGVVGAIALVFDSGGEKVVLRFLWSVVEGITAFFKNLPETIERFTKMFLDGIKALFTELPKMIGSLIRGVLFGIVELIKAGPELIVEIVKAIADTFVTILTETPALLIDIGVAIIEALIYAITDALPALIRAIPGMFLGIGEALINGLIGGIKAGFNSVGNAITGLFNTVVGGFKRLFGIRSPSRVFMGLGEYLTDGLALGVDRGRGDVSDSMDDLAKTIFDSVEGLGDDPDFSVHITPVIDMDEVDKELQRITRLDTNVTANAADRVLSRDGDVGGVTNNVTNITYTQNNTSPKPLSTIELYRNTERQLKLLQ